MENAEVSLNGICHKKESLAYEFHHVKFDSYLFRCKVNIASESFILSGFSFFNMASHNVNIKEFRSGLEMAN